MKLDKYPVIASISKFILPYIVLFAFYIQFNGEDSPGGGFQAGVIFAAGFISYIMVFGSEQTLISQRFLLLNTVLGTLIYAGVGIATIFFGGNFLDYSAIPLVHPAGQRLGIMLIELGVGLTVASGMLLIFQLFNQ